jgi:hypothetical protein
MTQLHARTFGRLRCECGRVIQPHDPELINTGSIRLVCAGCHRDLLELDLTEEDECDEI